MNCLNAAVSAFLKLGAFTLLPARTEIASLRIFQNIL